MAADLQTKCCICFPVHYGLLLWAFFKMILSIVIFFPYMLLASAYVQLQGVLFLPMIIGWVVAADMAFSIVLTIAAYTDNSNLLKVYFYYILGHIASVSAMGLYGGIIHWYAEILEFTEATLIPLSAYIFLLSYINYIIRCQYMKVQKTGAMDLTNDSFTCKLNLPHTIMGDEKKAVVDCAKYEKMSDNSS